MACRIAAGRWPDAGHCRSNCQLPSTRCHSPRHDLGTGFISESNGAQGVIKRPIKGFDDPITIGWVCQKAHTLSQPAERFIQLLQKYGRDLPEA